jgi:hypothetical protein
MGDLAAVVCRQVAKGWCTMRLPTDLLSRFHRDQRGQAIFIGVFYFLLLAALIFFVFNSGDKANNKIAMQNDADAAVVTGSGWYARGLNAIAMCNVAQTQFLSVIVLLDSMQTAAPIAQQSINDLLSNIRASNLGRDVPNNPILQEFLIVGNAAQEQRMVQTINQMISQVPMDEYCTYDSGVLWQCCYVLNELADQMAAITPEMCQREATKVATADQADVGFLLPFSPVLPTAPVDNSGASFKNFRNPMTIARTPTGESIPGYSTHQGYTSRRGHGTLGPFRYMREPFTEPEPMGLFELSCFSTLYESISDSKLDMLFGGADASVPQLISSYDALVAYVKQNGPGSVLETYWATAGFFTRYQFPTPQFYANSTLRYPPYPSEPVNIYSGFQPAPGGYTRSSMPDGSDGADAQENTFYQVTELLTPLVGRPPWFLPALGIYLPHPPPYTPAEQQIYYRVSLWRFCGALVAGQTPMRSKYLPPLGQPPHLAPILMQSSVIPRNATNVFNWFNFVAFAYKNGNSQIWPKYFPNPVPTSDKLICYGEAEVYNNTCPATSWNTFTQDWRSRLVRMDHWNWSAAAIGAGVPPGTAAGNYVTADNTAPVLKMLQMYDAGGLDGSNPDTVGSYVQLITH